jgi:hypothetical protein
MKMPVTAIYIHQPNTTLTIESGETPLISETGTRTPTDKPVTLAEGAYLIASEKAIVVTGEGRGRAFDVHVPIQSMATGGGTNKDDWPEPPKKFAPRKDAIVEWLNARGGDAF